MTTFLIVDDHPLFLEAIQIAVRAVAPSAEIHEAGDIETAVEAIASHRRGFDLALIDLGLPGTSGFDGVALLRRRFPSLPLLVISGRDDPATVREVMAHGVSGFVSKASSKAEMAKAIAAVLAGEIHLPDRLAAVRAAPQPVRDTDAANRLASLTPQQSRVLGMLRQGKLNKQIAHELDVGETTVKAHVSEILRKLGVFSRTQAVIEAARIDLPPPTETPAPTMARR